MMDGILCQHNVIVKEYKNNTKGGKEMEMLTTTPHNFLWRVKNPQDYWANTRKEVKYIVEVNGIELGKFHGVNRSFDDDTYYVNFYDENDNLNYCSVDWNSEMILKSIE